MKNFEYKRTGCGCEECLKYYYQIIKVVKKCKCVCHDDLFPSGHDGLCCEFPNTYRKGLPIKFKRK